MKKHISKFLLCLFKILGKLIPYFNHKYMALQKNTILNAINSHIRRLFTNEYPLFVIQDGITTISNMNHHEIQYNVIYNNLFTFNIFISYTNGVIKKELYFPTRLSSLEDNDEINNFFNHFKLNEWNPTDLFIALNDAI